MEQTQCGPSRPENHSIMKSSILRGALVEATDHSVVPLERLQRQLVFRLYPLFHHFRNFSGKHGLCWSSTVDTIRLDADQDTASNLEEQMSIQTHNTRLIRLRDISEDYVDHRNQHSVSQWVPRVLDDRDDVRTVCRHVDQVTPRPVRELDSEDGSRRAHNVRNMRDGCARRRSQIQHFRSGPHVDGLHATQDACRKLAAERIPHAVLGLGGGCDFAVRTRFVCARGRWSVDHDALLTVDSFSRGNVLGDEQVLFAARNENTRMAMRFLRR